MTRDMYRSVFIVIIELTLQIKKYLFQTYVLIQKPAKSIKIKII